MLHQGVVDIDAHFVSNREPIYAECGSYKPFTVATIKAAERRGYIVEWVKRGVCYVHAPGSITAEQLERRSQQRRAEWDLIIENRERLRIAKDAALAGLPELIAALGWALDQIEDDLDPDHQAAFAAARATFAKFNQGEAA